MHTIGGAVIALNVLLALPHAANAAPQKRDWSQVENVKDAAKRLGKMQTSQGADATLKFLEACYKTHMLAEKFTAGLEACMAQDYMLSQMLAVVYARVPQEQRDKMKAPAADVIAHSMRGRFQSIFAQYKFTQDEADNLKKAVDKHAMPIYIKAVFPKTDKKEDERGAPGPQSGDGN